MGFTMSAKRNFNSNDILSVLKTGNFSTGEIARKIRCDRVTALKYLRELKAQKRVKETRISTNLNVWQLTHFGNQILFGDCAEQLKAIVSETVDLIVTDPPYGIKFMGKNWDKALPSPEALKECLRVLKPGAFAFIMCSTQQTMLSHMIIRLSEAGFETRFSSIYWTYARGQPKINKVGEAFAASSIKPATEVILICMKSLAANSYSEQFLKNSKGVLWFGDCKIPYAIENSEIDTGRFPANVLCCDDVLNNGDIHYGKNKIVTRTAGAGALGQNAGWNAHQNKPTVHTGYDDTGSYSRFFDLDAWFKAKLPEQAQKTFPYLIVPKPSKNEKNRHGVNEHPTVKPLKLMSYLITMGSREGDLVLDPYAGSGTTLEAANMLKRRFIGCELDEKYKDLIEARAYMRTAVKA